MKSIVVVCLLALAGVALGLDEAVPTLPGLGSPCLPHRDRVDVRWQKRFETPKPRSFKGSCVRESACAPAQQVHGYCAGIGVVCCKGYAPSIPKAPISIRPSTPFSRPNLQASASPCGSAGGTCKDVKACAAPSTTRSGLCPGTPASVKCCIPPKAPGPVTPPVTPNPPAMNNGVPGSPFTTLIRIPSGINAGLNFPSAKFQIDTMGRPGCALTPACFSCNCASSDRIKRLKVTQRVTDSVSITGLAPFVAAVKAAFDAMAASGNPEAMAARQQVRSAGGLCCRPIKTPSGAAAGTWSNHSWGLAVDFYFGGNIDPRGDGKTQRGLAVMAPFFQAQGLYWAAGYAGASEDAMHFEASVQLVTKWKNAGLLK